MYPNTQPLSRTLAAESASVAAQLAAIKITKLRSAVLTNPLVTDDAFKVVYGKKERIPSAKKALKRPMSQTQMLHVVDVEARPQVIAAMLEATFPTAAVFERLGAAGHLADETVVNVLARYWAPNLPLEWLNTIPAPVPGRLRVWRLLRDTTMTDQDMADQLDSYDSWGDKYDQPVLAWILAKRPGLLPLLVSTRSHSVRTQVAASHLFGRLSADEQRTVLELDKAEGASHEWLESHSFAWMAAGGNLTTHLEVLPDLVGPLKQFDPTKWGVHAPVTKRINQRNWRVADFTTETDPMKLAAMVQHVVLGGKKDAGRPHSLPALLDNPHLGRDEAVSLAGQLVRNSALAKAGWAETEVGDALAHLEARFPDLSQDGTTLTTWWSGLRDRLLGTSSYDPHVVSEETLSRGAANADRMVLDLEYDKPLLRWLEAQLEGNEEAWHILYTVVDSFDGSVRELAAVCGVAA